MITSDAKHAGKSLFCQSSINKFHGKSKVENSSNETISCGMLILTLLFGIKLNRKAPNLFS